MIQIDLGIRHGKLWKKCRKRILNRNFIATDPQRYGFTVIPESEMNWTLKDLNKAVSLEVLSEISGIKVKQLQAFNPELRQGTIPPLKENETYRFRLPEGFNENFDSLYAKIEIEKVEET